MTEQQKHTDAKNSTIADFVGYKEKSVPLLFDSDWNWIMVAVKKIGNEFERVCEDKGLDPFDWGEQLNTALCEIDIDMLNNFVVEYINEVHNQ